MRIKSLVLYEITLPFRQAFAHASATRDHTEAVILRVELSDGTTGYGECIPRSYVTGETVASVVSIVADTLWPALSVNEFHSLMQVHDWLALPPLALGQVMEAHPCAVAALDLALLDAASKSFRQPLVELFGGAKNLDLSYSAVVSADAPEAVRSLLSMYKKMAFSAYKLKLTADARANAQVLQLSRAMLGNDISLRVDLNEAWDWAALQAFLPLAKQYAVEQIEQPFAKLDAAAWEALAGHHEAMPPICLDESLCSRADLERFAGLAAPGTWVINIRMAKNGGLCRASALHALAAAKGIPCQLGAQVGETSLLTAAGVIFATTHACKFLEGAFGLHLLESDITKRPLMFGAAGKLSSALWLQGLGLGCEVAPELLAKMTTKQHVCEA